MNLRYQFQLSSDAKSLGGLREISTFWIVLNSIGISKLEIFNKIHLNFVNKIIWEWKLVQ